MLQMTSFKKINKKDSIIIQSNLKERNTFLYNVL